MAKPNQEIQDHVTEQAVSMLRKMLTFATTVGVQAYIIDRTATQFREFEAEAATLEDDTAIMGTGIIATPDELAAIKPSYEQNFFHDNVPLGSHELGAYISLFPLKAAAASYVFTLLEVFGDDVASIVNPGSINRNKAWHEDIKGFADLKDPVQVMKAREAFAKHFAATADDVPEIAARRMVSLKGKRNDFAHEAASGINFNSYLRDALAVVCHITFLVTDLDRLSVYPWEDHRGRFSPQTRI